MAPPNNRPDPYEQEFAIRQLTEAMRMVREQLKENSEGVLKNREDILVIKAKWSVYAAIAGAGSAIAVKLLMH